MKKILVACGNGIATSTMVASKIRSYLSEKGVDVDTTQKKMLEIPNYVQDYDLLVTTGKYDGDTKGVPHIQATQLLTGIGQDEVLEQIYEVLTN